MRDRSASEVGVLARQQQESNAEDAVDILRRIFYVLDFVLVLDTPRKMMNRIEDTKSLIRYLRLPPELMFAHSSSRQEIDNVLCRAWMPFQSAHHGCPSAANYYSSSWCHDRKKAVTYVCTIVRTAPTGVQLCDDGCGGCAGLCFLLAGRQPVCYVALGSTCRCGVGVDLLDRISAGGEDKIGISNVQHLQVMLLLALTEASALRTFACSRGHVMTRRSPTNTGGRKTKRRGSSCKVTKETHSKTC